MKALFKFIVVALLNVEAKAVLRMYRPKIIAVTGSVGKTSTKDAVFTAVSSFFRARKSEKSFNSEFGVPLTILGLRNAWNNPFKWLRNLFVGLELLIKKSDSYPELLVLEVGADRPGDIKNMSEWLRPQVAIITRFAEVPVHIEFFKDREQVIEEKTSLALSVPEDGLVVLGADDEEVLGIAKKTNSRVLTYGTRDSANVRGGNYEIKYELRNEISVPVGIRFEITVGQTAYPVHVEGCLGKTVMQPILAGLAVGKGLNLDISKVIENFKQFSCPPGRMRVLKGMHESTVIDDSYNASPVALSEALDTLASIETKGRKIAILGDMMELGKYTAEEHEKAGVKVGRVADKLITVGIRAKGYAEGARKAGMSPDRIIQFSNSIEASEQIKNMVNRGDVILVKGSQSPRLERIVKALLLDTEKASELLVRQEKEWQKR